ncbi:methylphosphonate hydroxylase-like [Oscarella lobularis]|uniref:methylphosphonate hydroxylase-like n=1 Tax=Oscarella lobularis TaxID=121494 RepID=UPI003313FF9C
MAVKVATGVSDWISCRDRIDVASTKAFFVEKGYINEKGFLSESEVQTIRDELQRYREEVVPSIPSELVFYENTSRPETLIRLERMHSHDDFFRRLSQSSAINGLADELLGKPCEPNNVQFFSKPPGAKATPPHQDGQYFMHDKGMTFWLALDTADKVNGCMFYVPESYKKGLLRHQKTTALGFSQALVEYPAAFLETEICMEASPGTLLGHHPYTVHRAGPNKDSTRWRKALGITYWAKECKTDKQHQAKYRSYHESLEAQLKAEGKI